MLSRELITPFVYRNRVDPTIAEALSELVVRSRNELSPDPERDISSSARVAFARPNSSCNRCNWSGAAVNKPCACRARCPRWRGSEARGLRERSRSAGYPPSRTYFYEPSSTGCSGRAACRPHLLPSDSEEYARLARSMGFSDGSGLQRELELARERVSSTFQSLTHHGPAQPSVPRAHLISELEGDDPELGRVAEEQFKSADMGEHVAAPGATTGRLTRSAHSRPPPGLDRQRAGCPWRAPQIQSRPRAICARFSANFWLPRPTSMRSAMIGAPCSA